MTATNDDTSVSRHEDMTALIDYVPYDAETQARLHAEAMVRALEHPDDYVLLPDGHGRSWPVHKGDLESTVAPSPHQWPSVCRDIYPFSCCPSCCDLVWRWMESGTPIPEHHHPSLTVKEEGNS